MKWKPEDIKPGLLVQYEHQICLVLSQCYPNNKFCLAGLGGNLLHCFSDPALDAIGLSDHFNKLNYKLLGKLSFLVENDGRITIQNKTILNKDEDILQDFIFQPTF